MEQLSNSSRNEAKYGTISEADPEEAPLSSNKQFLSQTKELLQTIVGTPTPWKDMIHPSHLTFPFSFFNSIRGIKTNARVFPKNYVIVLLLMVLLSLPWLPLSVNIFCAVMAAWMVLFFVRDALRAFGYEIDERLVAALLLLMTVGLIFLSNVRDNILVGMCVELVVVLVHGVTRETGEDEQEAAAAAIVKIRLRHAASSSFTASFSIFFILVDSFNNLIFWIFFLLSIYLFKKLISYDL